MSNWRTLSAAFILGNAGLLLIYFLPQLVGVVAEQFELNEKQMGLFASSDLIGYSIGSISSYLWIRNANWRTAALVSILIMVVGNLCSPMIHNFSLLLFLRVITGIGQGMAVAITLAVISDTVSTDRNFAIYLIITLIVGAVGVVILPDLIQNMGARPIYWGQVICSIISIPFVIKWLPSSGVSYEDSSTFGFNRAVYMCLFSVLLLYVGYGGLWALSERIGTSAGLSPDYIGWCLSISLLWAIAGLIIPIIFDVKFGRLLPITVSIISLCLYGIVLVLYQSEMGFLFAVSIGSFGINMILPYITGVIGDNDDTGKGVIMVTPMYSIGFALGPAVLALLIVGGDYTYLGYGATFIFAICFIMFLYVMKKTPLVH